MIPIHIGILGGGNISDTHARAAREVEGVEIAAVYGHNQEKSKELARRYGGVVYPDFDAFLRHRPMDLIVIGSPSGRHAEQGIAAARLGLHLLIEKPIDIDLNRADALIGECDKAGVKLGVCFQDRTAPDLSKLKQLIDAGSLGKPILASAQVLWYRPPEYYRDSRWRGTYALDGGGALINQGVHTVDLLLWLMGDVTRVQAKTITALHDIEVEDTVAATLEFSNGAIGTLQTATSAYPGYPRRLELTGSGGTIIVEGDRITAADLRTPPEAVRKRPACSSANVGGAELSTPEACVPITAGDESSARSNSPVVSDVSGHRRLFEDFIRAIQSNGRPLCDGREGRKSLALVKAIYESSRTGQAVVLSQEKLTV
jgi:predicted dehydrogenase